MDPQDEKQDTPPGRRHVAKSPRKGRMIAVVAVVAIGGAAWGATTLLNDPDPNLDPSVVELTSSCTGTGAAGTVSNLDEGDVTAVIEVEFLDADGVFLHKASATRPGIAPGDSVDWELDFDASLTPEGAGDYADCVVSVPSVFRFNR